MSSDSKNPQHNGAAALAHEPGKITCRSVERRKLYETQGIEDRVIFVGPAAEAGRQAEEGDHEQEENDEDVRDETGFDDQAQTTERDPDE